MSKAKCYLKSARLRTLPLSLAGIITGAGLAIADYRVSAWAVFFTALTAVFLQILSNVSNEYGDFTHGTDRDDRQGPQYSYGELEDKDYRRMIVIYAVLSCASGLAMIYTSFGSLFTLESIMLMLLGAAAIAAAIKYTVGKNPYGYRGLGDIYVLIFFGIVSVTGSYFVLAHEIPSWTLLLPALGIGFFSVGVLNVNNLRDMKTDALTRTTTAIKLGVRKTRIYHVIIISLGWICLLSYVIFCRMFYIWHFLFVLTLPLFIIHVKGVLTHEGRELDRYLPMLVMSTFALSILLAIGFTVYLF